jgi:large subunit ribosomal protein L13
METITIDAKGMPIGRVASRAAMALRAKHRTDIRRDRISGVSVNIIHASELAISPKKLRMTTYVTYSGYPGGKRTETLESLIARRGVAEAVRRAIYGMLPNNRHRAVLMKRIHITE